jgi:RNA polymerase sigma factor (sigma-70 family)
VGHELDAEIYEKHADELVRFATFLVRPSDGPDLVSSAVLRVLSSHSATPIRNWRAYLYRAVLNEARMRDRRYSRQQRCAAFRLPTATSEAPEIESEVLEAVARLSPRQRAVVFLTYWDDLDPAAVASTLGLGEGSVRRHLARARARLRKMLHE